MKKIFVILAIAVAAIATPTQVCATELNNQAEPQLNAESLKKAAVDAVIRLFEFAISADQTNMQKLQQEVMTYASSLNQADQAVFIEALELYTKKCEELGDKAVFFIDQIIDATQKGDQAALDKIKKLSDEYVATLNAEEAIIFDKLGEVILKRAQQMAAK